MRELSGLVRRAQTDDLEAYNEIVRRLQDMAVMYAYSLLGDFHLAEDVAQESFVAAYLDLHKLQAPGIGAPRRGARRSGRAARPD